MQTEASTVASISSCPWVACTGTPSKRVAQGDALVSVVDVADD